MKKILFLLFLPLLSFAKDSASFQLEVGGRWDRSDDRNGDHVDIVEGGERGVAHSAGGRCGDEVGGVH